jgi:hypothetical protein
MFASEPLSRLDERIKHALDPVVVAVDQGIVENYRDSPSLLGEHRAHRQAHEDGNLLLRAVRKPIEGFRAMTFDTRNGKTIPQLQLRTGKRSLRKGRRWRRTGS